MTHEENWRASDSGSDDALFLSDEALLSQILLHTLIREAAPSSSPPQHLLQRRDGTGSIYSEISMATIRTRRDENGRRYGSEEARYSSNSGNLQDVVGLESSDGCRDDMEQTQQTQVVVAPQQGNGGADDGGLQSAKEGGVEAAWWARR
jgi:hypothetical protein